MFWQNEEYATGLGADICLDGVVCVVDALFGEKVRHKYACIYLVETSPSLFSKCPKLMAPMA